MEYSDGENESDVEMIDDIVEPSDLFNDEAQEGGGGEQNDNEKQQEKQEDSKSKVEKEIKQRKFARNVNTVLNFHTLDGSNGLRALKNLFKNFKFKGSGHEKEDLVKIMGILQQWMCFQLCPSYDFENCMQHLEDLGKRKIIQTLIKKFRLGMDEWNENQLDTENFVENNIENNENSNKNEFDLLLDEEMAKIGSDDELSQNEEMMIQQKTQPEPEVTLTPEQLERIARNKKLAEERRLKKMKDRCEEMEIAQPTEKTGNQEISLENISLEENS